MREVGKARCQTHYCWVLASSKRATGLRDILGERASAGMDLDQFAS